MRIVDVQTVLLTGPCTRDKYITPMKQRRSAAFVEITTDSGLVGIGETYAGYFCPEIVPEIVEFFKPVLVGQEPMDIDKLWENMYQCGRFWCRVGLGAIVLTGIEAALWDLKGKMLGQPVYELLGGTRHKKILCYATGAGSNYPKDRLKAKIEYYLSFGFKAVKFGAGYFDEKTGEFWCSNDRNEAADFESDKLNFIRQSFGNDLTVCLDGHMDNHHRGDDTWTLDTAKAVANAVEPFGLFFFEEPLRYVEPDGYAELCRSTEVPIAGGECLTTYEEWKNFADKDTFDIAQPDASFVGGMNVFMKIADLFDQRERKIATHCWGAGGALMQNLHCAFASKNICIFEVAANYGPLHSEIIGDSFVMEDGYVLPPRIPGLGIELTDKIKNKYPFERGVGEFNSVEGKVMKSDA